MGELKAYEIKDGAYGMYLAEDGFPVDVDFEFVYPKEPVDKVIAELKAQINALKKQLPKRDDT